MGLGLGCIVTILILIDGFLQFMAHGGGFKGLDMVTILILIDGFLQYNYSRLTRAERKVTILILIDGFLQYNKS